MSIFTLLPAVKVENSNLMLVQTSRSKSILWHPNTSVHRSFGGALMVSVGVLYLVFEKSILSSPDLSTMDLLSKSILGAQVGLIMLAMFVTRSSIASLQAKRGLPLGNQVVGWLILGMS
jgi:phosphatidylinositol glycan class N